MKEKKYEVTIGMPVYQVERYIRESLESVLAQTFGSIEYLICDDCGTDSSVDIVREYQKSHPRGGDIHIVRQPRNMGLGCARNRMIEEAQGRYIYFMDSDDLLTENAIALLMEQAVKYDADIVYGSMEKVLLYDHGRRERSADYAYRVFLEENEFASWVYQRYDMIQASTCNFLIKLDIYRSNHIAYKPINYWEDFTTTMDLPTYVTRVVMLPDVTYLYMCRTGSLSNYQQREHIDKAEIEQTMQAVAMIKASSGRLLGKPYFPRRMYKVMLTCFYVVCTVLKNEGRISPPFTSRELRDFMRYPVALSAVWSRGGWPLRHLLLYVMGALPASLSVVMMRLLGRVKKLI